MKYRMRIVFLADDFPPMSYGGAGISTYDIARILVARGHEVHVITTVRKREDAGVFSEEGMTMHRIVSRYNPFWRAFVGIYNPQTIEKVTDLYKTIKPDIVHAHNVHQYLSYYTIRRAKKYSGGVVFTARDVMSIYYGKLNTRQYLNSHIVTFSFLDMLRQVRRTLNPLYFWCVRKILACADVRLAVSNELSNALSKNGVTDIQTLHTGLVPAEWYTTRDEELEFRKRFNLGNKKIVFHSGRLSSVKGSDALLCAMDDVFEHVHDAVLVIAGVSDDGYQAKIASGHYGTNLSGKVIFTGWLSRAEARIASGSAFVTVVPSLCLDAFPRVVLEGMAAGKPVVGSHFGGIPEAIVHGQTGFVIDPRNTKEFAEKIRFLLQHPDQAAIFGANGKKRIHEQFNLTTQVEKHERIYVQLLNKHL